MGIDCRDLLSTDWHARVDVSLSQGQFHGYITAPKDLGDQFVPNLASAKKNMRKSRAAAIRNRAQKSALRTALKRASAGTAEERLAAVKLLDGHRGRD